MPDVQVLSAIDENADKLKQPEIKKKRPYYFQLDVLKAVAISFVIMDHSLTWEMKGAIGSLWWERLSIPFFLIIMGFNMGLSFKYHGASSLRDLYSNEYFRRKIVRYILPFLVLYMLSILLGLYFGYLDTSVYLLLGFLPFWGPGDWFIPLLFGSIVIFPAVYWAFKKYPILTMILCFMSEIVMQLVLYIWFPSPINSMLEGFIVSAIRVNALFFLPAIALGLWFSEEHNLYNKRNWCVVVYAAISIIFMFDYATHFLQNMTGAVGTFFALTDDIIKGDYTLLFYGYAALIFLLALFLIPEEPHGKVQHFIQRIGRSSYHIFLFQILWMSIIYWNTSHETTYYREIPEFATIFGWSTPLLYIPFYLVNLTISFGGGLLWYELERRANAKDKPWWQHIWMKRTYYLFGAVMSLVFMSVLMGIVSDLTGLNAWQRDHGPHFIFNEHTGPGFMANFIIIIFSIGLSMMFLYKAFTINDEIIIE